MSKNISFVSEAVLEEKRKQRQEEWQKNRKEDDPLEAPEPAYDPRTLYERLKEQKLKKQEEYEESRKLKNLVKGLDNDEIEFLTMCDNSKVELENQKYKEELLALEEYKQAVAHLNTEEQEHKLLDFKRELFQKHKKNMLEKSSSTSPKKKSQASLLMGAIKRKEKSEENCSKKLKPESTAPIPHENIAKENENEEKHSENEPMPTLLCIGRLPGIGCYDDDSDSSNSDRESNESDNECEFNIFPLPTNNETQNVARRQ